MLDIEVYNNSEKKGYINLSNRFIRAFRAGLFERGGFPTRVYDDFSLQSGVYQSLKIDLGQAKGDNWWCVVFPAVCFTSSKNPQNLEYISKIWDTIQSVTKR